MPAAEISPGWGAGGCEGCPRLTWKRVASLSGEVSPLVWLGGGTGDLGTKERVGWFCAQPLRTRGKRRRQPQAPNWDQSAR